MYITYMNLSCFKLHLSITQLIYLPFLNEYWYFHLGFHFIIFYSKSMCSLRPAVNWHDVVKFILWKKNMIHLENEFWKKNITKSSTIIFHCFWTGVRNANSTRLLFFLVYRIFINLNASHQCAAADLKKA